ncbi:MAG TPA: PAS domain S-box protein, partial [Bacteroidia bacterium]|nr:PAS domain S-box protein [Bacteroidia bacterium]
MRAIDFKLLLESVPGCYLILKPDFQIIAVSDAYLEATMTKREAITGKALFEVFPDNPDDPEATGESNLRASLQEVLKTGEAHKMAVQKYDIRRPDGTFEERYWDPLNKPVLNTSQKVEYIVHSVIDITRRVKAESQIMELNAKLKQAALDHTLALEKSSKLFFTLFNLNPASIAISRIDNGKILHVNEAFLSTFGFSSKKDVIGKTAHELKIFFDPGQRSEILKQLNEPGKVAVGEGQIRTPNMEVKWVSTFAHHIEIDDVTCMLAVTIDITKRKTQEQIVNAQAEELKQANKELETFSYSVSHDLKAPLRSLEGFSKLLSEEYAGKLDEDGQRWLHFISENANKMSLLISDILAFSKVSRSTVNKSKVDMKLLAREVFDAEKNNYPEKP